LKKQAEELKSEFLNVQKQWITNQAKLIDEQSERMKIGEECSEMRTKSAILESKKFRLNNSVIQYNKEIA